jgi:hypothetical protein
MNQLIARPLLAIRDTAVVSYQTSLGFSWRIQPPGKRLKQAKQAALRLIRSLPPEIKGHVEYRFTSQHWAPLLAAKP